MLFLFLIRFQLLFICLLFLFLNLAKFALFLFVCAWGIDDEVGGFISVIVRVFVRFLIFIRHLVVHLSDFWFVQV